MQALELLAPAKDKTIGIAAISCGADAVYIAGPDFGNRHAAGNSFEDIAELCNYAHNFGAKVYLTVNVVIYDHEWEELHRQMLAAQEAGVDAFIFRDERVMQWDDIHVPMHASTQCAIRDVERARHFDSLGCERLILEREMTLDQIRQIRGAVACELEFFVHGALCVCYSGDCRLSEFLDGRSADRGECIQACRSLYDLVDEDGKQMVRNKALLSLKDYKLLHRLEDLADAGICSFKIEGRLKNESYVKNVVREYDLALNDLVSRFPEKYCRASWGHVSGGFSPDSNKTFNRGYTELWLDGRRGQWSSMDAPKSMGELVGSVADVRVSGKKMTVKLAWARQSGRAEASSGGSMVLSNGDGFAFVDARGGIVGFRGDICQGNVISCKVVEGLRKGMKLYRNISAAFEKELETKTPCREIQVSLKVSIRNKFDISITAVSEDGRSVVSSFEANLEIAQNRERAEAMIREQLSKRSGVYVFHMDEMEVSTPGGVLPLLSASTINSMRRLVAEDLSSVGSASVEHTSEKLDRTEARLSPSANSGRSGELMRTRYCIRYELGICPKHHGASSGKKLYLVNNGRRLSLQFDCKACEMTVNPVQTI